MADRDECRCEGCGLPNEYCFMLQKGMCGTNAELSKAWDKIEKLKAEKEALMKLAHDYIQAYEKLAFGDAGGDDETE